MCDITVSVGQASGSAQLGGLLRALGLQLGAGLHSHLQAQMGKAASCSPRSWAAGISLQLQGWGPGPGAEPACKS